MKKIYALLLFIFLGGTSFAQDVLVNGNLETWTDTTHPDSWTRTDNITQESTNIFEGTYSAKQESTGGTKKLGQTINGIIPGDTYVLTIHYKVESGDGTDARIWSKWKGANGALPDYADDLQGPATTSNGYLDTANADANGWSVYTVSMTAPTAANKFYFEVRTYSGAVVYWDDFSFVHQAPTTPTLTITSPVDGKVFAPNVTDVNVDFVVQNFNVAQSGGDGYIQWQLDSGSWTSKYDTNTIQLTGLTAGSSHTVSMKLVDNSGNDLNPPVTSSVNFSIATYTQVNTLADLRAGTVGNYYHFTGEAYITGAKVSASGNVTGFAQDATAGIAAYVIVGTSTNQPNLGDGVTDLKGKLIEYHGLLEIKLVEDFTMTGNNVAQTPQVVTLADFLANQDDYESELIKFENVTIDPDGDTTFQANANYDVTDGTETTVLRTSFPDLVGETIPTNNVNITGIASEYNGTAQIFPRNINDIVDASGAIGENNIAGLQVYPNPVVNKQVFVTSNSNDTKLVVIYDILGKAVYTTEVNNNQVINIGQLKAGVYMMKISENGHLALQKLIIK